MVFEGEIYQDSKTGAICVGLKDWAYTHFTVLSLVQIEEVDLDVMLLDHFSKERYCEYYDLNPRCFDGQEEDEETNVLDDGYDVDDVDENEVRLEEWCISNEDTNDD